MVEPITTGALVAAALAAGASTIATGALGAAGKDAYEKLKSLISRIAGSEVARLEAKPDSENRAGVVAELVDERAEAEKAELLALAEQLRAALTAEGHGAAVDNRMNNVFNAYDKSRQYNAPGGTQNFGAPPRGLRRTDEPAFNLG